MSNLILYDIDSARFPGVSWSGNTLKPHIVLRYKGIPYETVWLSFDEIKSNHEKLGIKPGTGVPSPYTLPAIKHDHVVMQDSYAIAEYLEKTFPDTPSVFPHPGVRTLQTALESLVTPMMTSLVVPKLVVPQTPAVLGGTGGEYFRRSRSEMLGVDLDKLCKEEEKPQLLEAWGKFVKTLDELFKAEEGGPWMTGKDFSGADALVLALMRWIELVAPDAFKLIEAQGPTLMKAYQAGAKYYTFT